MDSYSKTAMERAMKVQAVILRAMAKKITWWQAGEILGTSDRRLWRIRKRYEHQHLDGTFTITYAPQRLGHNSAEGVSLARKAMEKTPSGKVQKPTFPLCLEIAQTPRDSHFPHSFGCCCIRDEQLSNKRGHFYCGEIGDISNALRQVLSTGLTLRSQAGTIPAATCVLIKFKPKEKQ